jgi:hypothetical protein
MLDLSFLFVGISLEGWSFSFEWVSVFFETNRPRMSSFSSPSYTTLLRRRVFFLYYGTCQCRKPWNSCCRFCFSVASQLMKGFFHSGSYQGERERGWSIVMKSHAFAFAVSTLASSERSDSSSAERFTFPTWSSWTQKRKDKCGPPIQTGALSGKRGLVLWEPTKSDLPLDVWAWPSPTVFVNKTKLTCH